MHAQGPLDRLVLLATGPGPLLCQMCGPHRAHNFEGPQILYVGLVFRKKIQIKVALGREALELGLCGYVLSLPYGLQIVSKMEKLIVPRKRS